MSTRTVVVTEPPRPTSRPTQSHPDLAFVNASYIVSTPGRWSIRDRQLTGTLQARILGGRQPSFAIKPFAATLPLLNAPDRWVVKPAKGILECARLAGLLESSIVTAQSLQSW